MVDLEKTICCEQHTSHDTKWIEHPVYGSCGEGHLAVVACCGQCPVAGKAVSRQESSHD